MSVLHTGGVPLVLESSVSLAEGQTRTPDLGALQNTFRTPYVVDEIRFALRWPNPGGFSSIQNFGGTVQALFKLGRVDITKDFVPIWNFGSQIQTNPDPNFTPTNAVEEQLVGTAGTSTAGLLNTYSQFKWRLPVPLLIPPGNVLSPMFRRIDDSQTGTVAVDVAYIGRRLPPSFVIPPQIDVPFVASWVSGEWTTNANRSQISSELHIVNPFPVPLKVQRLVGRLLLRYVASQSQDDWFNGLSSTFPPGVGITMEDSYGYKVVKDLTPPYHVFDFARRSWTFNKVLKPKERYTVRLTTLAGPSIADSDPRSLMVSAVGHRQERWR